MSTSQPTKKNAICSKDALKNVIKGILIMILFLIANSLMAQVGVGTTSPDPSSILDITSTEAGMLVPRMTETDKNNITSPATGLLIYQTNNLSGFYFYDGTSWISIGTGNKNTLDGAYDEGGAGAGKNITADNGAVRVDGTDGLLVTGTFGSGNNIDTEATGDGTRMFFNPSKAAFRAGYTDASSWANSNIGDYSTAFGYGTIASGQESTAMGRSTIASGRHAFASGFSTSANSYAETTIGTFSGGYSVASATNFNVNDRIFTIGNGTSGINRSNALIVYKSGLININDEYNMPLTDGSVGQVMTTDGAGNVTFQTPVTGGNTLDQAYDEGGAGAGRIIDAFDGAVQINGTNPNDSGLLVNNYAINGQEAIAGTFTAYPGFPVGSSKIVGAKAEAITYSAEAIGLEATVTFNDPINANSDMQNYGIRSNVNILNPASSSIINYGIQASASNGNENWAAYFGDPTTPAATVPFQYTGNVYVKDNLEIERGLIYRPNGAATNVGDILQYSDTNGLLTPIDPSTIFVDTDTDNQIIDEFSLSGNTLSLSLEDDGQPNQTVDLSALGGNTLDQAYNQGGAGAGSTIDATAGAVTIAGEDGLLVSGTFGIGENTSINGAGTRMFFNPREAVFRAGTVDSNQWASFNNGNYSVAMGQNTTASGAHSIALGEGSSANNANAISIGDSNTASDNQAIAIGRDNTASASGSLAMGWGNTASGQSSVAIGLFNEAPAFYETTMGAYATTYTASGDMDNVNDRIFSIGNGTTDINRSNALTILKSGLMNINDEYNMPLTDGTAGQVMTTNGAGVVTFEDPQTPVTEWTDEGIFLRPTDGDTKDVSIGKSTAPIARVDIETDKEYGIFVDNVQIGSSVVGGIYSAVGGLSTGRKRAFSSSIQSNSIGDQVGYYNIMLNNSSANKTGFENRINGTGNGDLTGVFNSLGPTSGSGDRFGVNNSIAGGGNADLYGTRNFLGGTTTGDKFGTYTLVLSNNASSNCYGNSITINGAGLGNKYGIYSEIGSSAGGTNNWAGYFLGRLYIGTDTSDGYNMPLTDGTAGQVMTTDGAGNVTFQTATNGDITDVAAGTGLIGGGTSGAVTLNVVGLNGLTANANNIQLGGTLNQDTTINYGIYDTRFNLNNVGDFIIQDGANDIFVAQDNGNVGIGTGAPDRDLTVVHGTSGANNGFKLQNANGTNRFFKFFVSQSTTNPRLLLYSDVSGETTSIGEFDATSGAYTATSDRRLKNDFKSLYFSWDTFMNLETLTYRYKKDPSDKKHIGMVAQDVEKIYPELINYVEEDDVYHMDYAATGVVAIKAIQELKNEVDILKTENAILKTKLNQLETIEARLSALEEKTNPLENNIVTSIKE